MGSEMCIRDSFYSIEYYLSAYFSIFTSGPPYAPRDLKVTRVVTRNAVLLSWLLPSMDDHYVSNGSKVVGYRVS